MSTLYVIREQIVEYYAKFGKWIDMALRFVFSLVTLLYLSSEIGYMSVLTKGVVVFGIALLCSILPLSLFILIVAVIIILHTYTISMVIAIAISIAFLLMFILYFRFTSDEVFYLLLTPVAFIFNIPFVIPVVFGLIGTTMTIIPVAFGTIVYYIIQYLKTLGEVATGAEESDMITQVVTFAKELLTNKEMWAIILILSVGIIVVNNVKKLPINHSWKFAIGAGIASNLIITLFCSIMFDVNIKIIMVILGSCLAALLGVAVEFMFLNVDYSRTENIEFEDDEYHYYVKAVPKISIGKPIRTVKHINNVEQANLSKRKPVKNTKHTSPAEEMNVSKRKPIKNPNYTAGEEVAKEPRKKQVEYKNQETMVVSKAEIEKHINNQANQSLQKPKQTVNYEQDHEKANYQLLKDNIKNEFDL